MNEQISHGCMRNTKGPDSHTLDKGGHSQYFLYSMNGASYRKAISKLESSSVGVDTVDVFIVVTLFTLLTDAVGFSKSVLNEAQTQPKAF